MFNYFDSINILVIPTDICNMNCKYCYHEAHFTEQTMMTHEVLEKLMAITIPNYQRVHFIWHGGEPLVMGLDFYKGALELQKKYSNNTQKVRNSIQTNLTLVDDNWVNFFIENKFGVGSSFDGVCNDYTRGQSEQILAGRGKIIGQGGQCGNIMVVSKLNIHSLIDSYEFFKKNNINYKMNMYIRTDNTDASYSMSLTGSEYACAMIELFDYWKNDTNSTIRVDPFEEIISYILFRRKMTCCHTSCLGKWIAVRYNGLITNCNRYYPDKYHFGNIIAMRDIREAFESDGFKNMLSDAISRRKKCKACAIYDYCRGGCNNAAMFENGMDNNGGPSCNALKALYVYIKDFIYTNKDSQIDITLNPRLNTMIARYQHSS